MFSPKYHGRTFNVTFGTSEAQLKENNRYHIITNLDSFDLITNNWKGVEQSFSASEIDQGPTKKSPTILSFQTKKGNTYFLNTDPDPCEKLLEAIKPVLNIPNPEIRFLALSNILPTFQFSNRGIMMNLHKTIMTQCTQLLTTFHAKLQGSNSISGAFVDLFSCAYRMRYKNTDALNTEETTKDLINQIRAYLTFYWCSAIQRAAKDSVESEDKKFYSKIISNAIETIGVASSGLGIPIDDLTNAVQSFPNNPDGLIQTSAEIRKKFQSFIETQFSTKPPLDRNNLTLLLNILLIGFSGLAAGIYQYDIDALAESTVFYTRAVFGNEGVEEKKKKLLEDKSQFLTELLRLLDGDRYEKNFQYIYCVWEMPDFTS